MRDERRKARRARIPGMRVIFESAAGERVEADVLDIGSGGLFIRTARPLAAGKRVSLDVQGLPGLAAWSAHGRVVWTREVGTKDAAPGMGVKLIDVDDAVVTAIDGLVDARNGTQSPTGAREPPAREPTVLGLGTPEKPAVAASPIVPVAPARERTVLGVGAAGAPAAAKAPERERSVQEPPPGDWDLPDPHEMPTREIVVPQVVPVPREEAPPSKPSPEPEPPAAPLPEASIAIDLVARKPQVDVDEAPLPALPRRRGGGWVLLLLLVAASAAGLYVMRGRIPWVQQLVDEWTATPPAPAPVVPSPSVPTATATPIPAPIPVPIPVTPSTAPSTTAAPSKAPAPAPAAPASGPAKRPAGDNPY